MAQLLSVLTASGTEELPTTENTIGAPRQGSRVCNCKGGTHKSLEIKLTSLKRQTPLTWYFSSVPQRRRRTGAVHSLPLSEALQTPQQPQMWVVLHGIWTLSFFFLIEKTSLWNKKLCKGPIEEKLARLSCIAVLGVFATREKRNVLEEENPSSAQVPLVFQTETRQKLQEVCSQRPCMKRRLTRLISRAPASLRLEEPHDSFLFFSPEAFIKKAKKINKTAMAAGVFLIFFCSLHLWGFCLLSSLLFENAVVVFRRFLQLLALLEPSVPV